MLRTETQSYLQMFYLNSVSENGGPSRQGDYHTLIIIVRSHNEDSHRPGGSSYPLDVITWCALPFSSLAGLKRQPEHFLSNDSGEALRLAESSHG